MIPMISESVVALSQCASRLNNKLMHRNEMFLHHYLGLMLNILPYNLNRNSTNRERGDEDKKAQRQVPTENNNLQSVAL